MDSLSKWFEMDTPPGWDVILLRSVKVAVVGFVVLQVKEVIDAGTFDTLATGTDALLIAGAYLVLNAIFMMLAKPTPTRRSSE